MMDTDQTQKLDVLVINPGGREKIYQQLSNDLTAIEPPLWSRLISGYVRDRGYSVEILDSEALNMGCERVAQVVADKAPTLTVMVVFGHQPSASTQMMVGAGETCQKIKEIAPDHPILIVGGHVSALPEQTITEEAVDYVCKGEGPITVVQLLEALKSETPEQTDWSTIQGLVWRNEDGEPVVNPSAPLITDLDKDLHGMTWDLLPMDHYRAHNWQCFGDEKARMPYASIYTSLGCPYKCSFCCINAPFDTNRQRVRSPQAVVQEIDYLYRTYGVKTFKIIDEMFVLNRRHVFAICDGIIALGYADELNFWAYSRVDTVKPDMLEKLRQAGIRWLVLGIESGSKHVRDGSEKQLRANDIKQVVADIQKANINVLGNYIFGLPDDTLETMRETLDLAIELNCEFANFYSAMAYPGSPLHREAIKKGWPLPDSWAGYSQHSYECLPLPTDTLPASEILKFRDEAFHEYFSHPRYLDMVAQRFGWETREHIKGMSQHRLRRLIVEQTEA
jgi:radical SAM superfamily enzyme YgiQ (UPF0313 family)